MKGVELSSPGSASAFSSSELHQKTLNSTIFLGEAISVFSDSLLSSVHSPFTALPAIERAFAALCLRRSTLICSSLAIYKCTECVRQYGERGKERSERKRSPVWQHASTGMEVDFDRNGVDAKATDKTSPASRHLVRQTRPLP